MSGRDPYNRDDDDDPHFGNSGINPGSQAGEEREGVFNDLEVDHHKERLRGAIGKLGFLRKLVPIFFIWGVLKSLWPFGGSSNRRRRRGENNGGGWFGKIIKVGFIGGILALLVLVISGTGVADYLPYAGETASNAAQTLDFDEEITMYQQAKARVFCLLKGPACLRQWQLNNTQRPGSDDVGETYGLKIDRFEVGSGSNLDVAYKDKGYEIPMSFSVSNTRHGLKGLNAYNVSYRVKVVGDRKRQPSEFCDTGWKPVPNAYSIRGAEDQDEVWGNNDIYPGTSANTGFLTDEKITVGNCGMLQPGAGDHRVVKLILKYDYSSQATLYFTALSQQTLQSDPSIEKRWKNSETADTPVKAAINVNNPVLFDEESNEPQPFGIRATLNTEEGDLKYRIEQEDLTIDMSEKVRMEESSSCKLKEGEKEGTLKIGDSMQDILEKRQENNWFTRSKAPPIFGCTMSLKEEEIGSISPSGETLQADIEANYTVSLDDPIDSFKIYNSRCTSLNCPLLVAKSQANLETDDESDDLRYRCDGLDAGNGCSVIEPGTWDNRELLTGSENKMDQRIEDGETVFDVSEIDGVEGKDLEGKIGREISVTDWAESQGKYDVLGLDEYILDRMRSRSNWVIKHAVRDGRVEAVYTPIPISKCGSKGLEFAKDQWNFGYSEKGAPVSIYNIKGC